MKQFHSFTNTRNSLFVARRGCKSLPLSVVIGLSCCLALVSTNIACAQQQPNANQKALTQDANTVMLLKPQADGLKDQKGNAEPIIRGGTIVQDERFGHALQFGAEARNDISVSDGGKFDFSKGMTLDMWIQIEQPDDKTPNPGGQLFVKLGSFYSTVAKNKLNVDWMIFPSVPVATTTNTQYKNYPASDTGFPGYIEIPTNRWAHVAFTYDPVLKVARTWIDGKLDWTEYYSREEAMPLLNDPNSALSFIAGMKNVRVGEIRVSDRAKAIETLTPFETYAHALPYRGQAAVVVDHIQPGDLPLDVVLQSGGKQLKKFTLTDPKTQTVFLDAPVAQGQYPLSIKATSKGKEVYSRDVELYTGDSSKQPVKIDEQNRLVMNGKPVFPLFMYHTFADDVPQLAKMGFTMFTPRSPGGEETALSAADAKSIGMVKGFLDVAKANNISMMVNNGIFTTGGWKAETNTKGINALTDEPALGIWYGEDEPGRDRIIQLQQGYTAAKQLTKRPIFSVTNRYDHLQRLAESADILGTDPYPIPNISLRSVADYTKASVAATAGLKPVWTVIPQYQYYPTDSKRPTLDEFRSMAYLAIASGAQGLGIYAWDDRDLKNPKGYQWYTKEHPEDVKILSDVIGELNGLQNVLIIPNSTRALSFAPNNPALHAAMKESGADNYLIVVSDSRQAEKATLSIDGLQSADAVDVRDASAKISIRDGKVEVQMPALGARLYKLSSVQKN